MGLAAPKNRNKIARDPRNLAWSANASTNSFGHKIMSAQGWSEGESLGSKTSRHHAGLGSGSKDENAARLAAARVGVIFKDDTLGLGAKLKSKDIEGQRTGMDAFMGLLGRLNAKDAEEEAAVEKKQEEKKLERYAVGRWGGMMFVPGGVLVGGEEFGTKKAAREAAAAEAEQSQVVSEASSAEGQEENDKAKRKAEKRLRKEARRVKREAKAARRAEKAARKSASVSASTSQITSAAASSDEDETPVSTPRSRSKSRKRTSAPDEPVSSSSEAENVEETSTKKRKRSETSTPILSQSQSPAASPRPTILPRNGRQLLRGRNIEAKRRAFQDAKGLDGIFTGMKAAA